MLASYDVPLRYIKTPHIMKKPQVPFHIYQKFKAQAQEEASWSAEGLSDMDMGYDPATGEYTKFGVEWDGMFGKHWDYYDTEEERSKAIDERQAQYAEDVAYGSKKILKVLVEKWLEKKREQERVRPTLGNLFAEAFTKLKTNTNTISL